MHVGSTPTIATMKNLFVILAFVAVFVLGVYCGLEGGWNKKPPNLFPHDYNRLLDKKFIVVGHDPDVYRLDMAHCNSEMYLAFYSKEDADEFHKELIAFIVKYNRETKIKNKVDGKPTY